MERDKEWLRWWKHFLQSVCSFSEGDLKLKCFISGSSCNGHARGNHDDELVEVANGVPMKDLSHLNPVIDNLLYPVTNIEPVTVVGTLKLISQIICQVSAW